MKLPTWAEAMYNVVDFGSHGDYKTAELWLAIARELREGAGPSLLPGKAGQMTREEVDELKAKFLDAQRGQSLYRVAGEPWEPGSTPSYRQYEWAKFARKQMDEYPGVPRLAIEVTVVQDIIETYERRMHPFRGHDGAPCLELIGDGFCDRPEGDPVHVHEGEAS